MQISFFDFYNKTTYSYKWNYCKNKQKPMANVSIGQIAHHNDQIIYIEPNDVFDKNYNNAQVGESLTPKYEDFCISFNLIIEAFTRFKNLASSEGTNSSDGSNPSRTYSIQWGLTSEQMSKRRTSILQGNRGPFTVDEKGDTHYERDDYNYLTTYYTDLTFDSYKNKTQIEGLGVESVQISYESWYTPTITIKFVDVRGSALFGREEAIHVDEQITADNVFGAFFTMPYPLFRLQVKGFLGRPVTYQLTCSSFKGSFNSNTGNFEAVATFIGYSWSLLTDIPFAYLVAAPVATYIGSDYWERHKNSTSWGLWNDGDTILPPPKLHVLFQNIKKAQDKVNDIHSAATSEQNEQLQQIESERKILNDIKNYLEKFTDGITKDVDGNFIRCYDEVTKKEQLLLFYDKKILKPNVSATRDVYGKLSGAIQAYQNSGYNSVNITSAKLPNGWEECPADIGFQNKFKIGDNRKINVVGLTRINEDTLKTVGFNGKSLTDKMTENLLTEIREKSKRIKKYAYIIDLFDISSLVNDRLKTLKGDVDGITDEINENININIIKLLSSDEKGTVDGFKPFIGNIFKIIFCHFETFCHIMFDSAEEIQQQAVNGMRSADYLGININQTDTIKEAAKYVTPWPAIFNQSVQTSECGYKSDQSNVYGWPGDLQTHNFIEEKVVYAIQEGIQRLANNNHNEESSIKYCSFPISPSDFTSGYDIFPNGLIGNVSELAGHLATRISSNIGVLCGGSVSVDLSKEMGKLDAYNLYGATASISDFSNIVNNVDEDLLKGIMLCKQGDSYEAYAIPLEGDTSKKYHTFEIVKEIDSKYNNQHHHPQFASMNGTNFYCHFYDENGINYTPSVLKQFINYKATVLGSDKGDFVYNAKNKTFNFTPNTYVNPNGEVQSADFIYKCDSSKISALNGNLTKYVNTYMFNIVTDNSVINAIKDKKKKLDNGGISIYDYEVSDDLTKYINTFIKVGDKYKHTFYSGVFTLSGNRDKLKLDNRRLLPDNIYGPDPTTITYPAAITKGVGSNDNRCSENQVSITEDFNFKFNGEEISSDDIVIKEFWLRYLGGTCSLFGCPFYYLQNASLKGESNEEGIDRKLKVKALLFLQTLCYNYNNVTLNVFSPNKKNGCTEEVPKAYLLTLGGFLWRKRYIKNHNNSDPIIYTDSDTGFRFHSAGINSTLLYNNKLSVYNYSDNPRYTPISKLFGGLNEIDYNIENQLIKLFENFSTTTFNKIISKYELKNQYANGVVKSYTYKSFVKDIEVIQLYQKNWQKNFSYTREDGTSSKNIKANISNYMMFLRNFGISGWDGCYSLIFAYHSDISANKCGMFCMFNEKDKEYQDIFKDLYLGSYIVVDSCYRRMSKSTSSVTASDTITVSDSIINSYLSGFVAASKDIINKGSVSVGDDNLMVSKETYKNRDLSLAIYYYLKNVWDKWLVVSPRNAFDVDNFFAKNFVFADSFYRNTYHLLAINCSKLLSAWDELADNGSIFNFLSRICSDHGCIFLPVPDYVGFNGETMEHDITMMEDLFRPLTYNSMEIPSNNNKFVVMYTHSPSKTCSNDNGYKIDSYDIWSHTNNDFTKEANVLFKSTNSNLFNRQADMATREGYNVPSFGVSFGRQNNHIFKNLDITMENPVMTEQSIKAQWQIALKGSTSANSVCFIGQDTFNVFSNYSYSVTVEMLGNAQICPLMYFQLFNVPLWKGTYMIYKVTHNMTPGNMTTTFVGMKMSKFQQPYNSSFFTKINFLGENNVDDSITSDCDTDGSTKHYDGTWLSAVETMGKWYEKNIHTYQGGSSNRANKRVKYGYSCDLINRTVYDDCSGFVCACLTYFGVPCGLKLTTKTMNDNNNFGKILKANGFRHMAYSKSQLQPGDIIRKSGHIEIYAGKINGKDMSWGWGNVNDKIHGKGQGMPCSFVNSAYTDIWRKIV